MSVAEHAPARDAPRPGPLAGITVLDLSAVGPASRCTRLLADYGCEVVKVGPVPGRGAAPPRPPVHAYSGSRYWKRIAIDLKESAGRQAFLALVGEADVVVESFRPGVLDRLGVGFAALRAVNPRIVLCSTTGYGKDGDRSGWAGHDLNYLAMGGYLASSERRGDGGPPLPGATVADAAAGGMQAALAVVCALVGRDGDGGGVHLDVSVTDGVLWLMSLGIDEHLAIGADVGPGHHVLSGRYACYGSYRAADGGWLAVAAIEAKFFANLCRLLGCPQWIDHQFDDAAQGKIRAELVSIFASRGRDVWVEELAGADTCVTPMLSVAELVEDAELVSQGAFIDAAGPAPGGPASQLRQLAPLLAGMERPVEPVDLPDPSMTDTGPLLERAGLSPERIGELFDAGVVA